MKKRKKPERGGTREGRASDEEQYGPLAVRAHTFCRIAKAVAGTDAWGQIASLDRKHTHVNQDEGKVRQRRQRAVVDPAEEGYVQPSVDEPRGR